MNATIVFGVFKDIYPMATTENTFGTRCNYASAAPPGFGTV